MLNSVKSKFACITALGVAAVATVGVFALKEKATLASALEVVLVDSKAIGNHKDADMMHDALRSDVLGSYIASTPEEAAAVEGDLREHAKLFRDSMELNAKADLPPEIRAALNEVKGPLTDYIAAVTDGTSRVQGSSVTLSITRARPEAWAQASRNAVREGSAAAGP